MLNIVHFVTLQVSNVMVLTTLRQCVSSNFGTTGSRSAETTTFQVPENVIEGGNYGQFEY